jgi:hypothetical protein
MFITLQEISRIHGERWGRTGKDEDAIIGGAANELLRLAAQERIATALERIAELMDPDARKQKRKDRQEQWQMHACILAWKKQHAKAARAIRKIINRHQTVMALATKAVSSFRTDKSDSYSVPEVPDSFDPLTFDWDKIELTSPQRKMLHEAGAKVTPPKGAK